MEEKKKILVHTCCAACASHVFFELKKLDFDITAFFYNPQIHGRAEFRRRRDDTEKHCKEFGYKLIVPEYNIHEFFEPLLPYQDERSIKFISDKDRYKRKRCQLCINLLISKTANTAKELGYSFFTSTMLCSPYKNHAEIWDQGLEKESKDKTLTFIYRDFRKGYWQGRNYARNHNFAIPGYCGCSESLEERILE